MKNKKHDLSSLNPFKSEAENTVFQENTSVSEGSQENEAAECELNQNDELQKKYNELNNQYIRLAADFDNYRKRQSQERESLLKYGAEETMKKLIEVLDNFDRGLKAIEKLDDAEKVKESYALVCNQMYETLEKLGMEAIESEGKEFDPNFHEAVMQTPTSDYPENIVISQLQKGYILGDKVLRAALVNVATPE